MNVSIHWSTRCRRMVVGISSDVEYFQKKAEGLVRYKRSSIGMRAVWDGSSQNVEQSAKPPACLRSCHFSTVR